MAATKKNSYTTVELSFAEEQLASWKKWLQDNPYNDIVDRKEVQLNKKTGGSFLTTVQTKEAIQKAHRDTLKEYLAMCEVLDKLRAADEHKKKEMKGGHDVPLRMRTYGTEE